MTHIVDVGKAVGICVVYAEIHDDALPYALGRDSGTNRNDLPHGIGTLNSWKHKRWFPATPCGDCVWVFFGAICAFTNPYVGVVDPACCHSDQDFPFGRPGNRNVIPVDELFGTAM